jgi:hypothetical protein
MSRFRKEWDLIPGAAFVIAGLVYLAYLGLMGSIWFGGPLLEGDPIPLVLVGFFLLTAFAGLFMVLFILLVGYVWADAKRRGMNAVLWVLLAIFIPNLIGVILYFILREPLPTPCPSCRAPVGKDLACCASCGTTVRPACPECHRPSEIGWTHCGHCGALLRAAAGAATP